MNKILFYLGESSFCLLVFYLLYALLLKRETGFQYNRFYLLITPLVSLILPLVRFSFFWQPKPLLNFVSTQLAPIPKRKSTLLTIGLMYPDASPPKIGSLGLPDKLAQLI